MTGALVSPLRQKYGLHLLDHHAARLAERGIPPEMAEARGYRSITTKADLGRRGFSPAQRRVPGLLIPLWRVDGKKGFAQYRPDDPRLNAEGKVVKYETPRRARMILDVHPFAREWLGDPARPLVITEGIIKGDSVVARGLCAVALLGVWAWRGRNKNNGKVALPDFEDVAFNGREVFLGFDSDVTVKREVQEALARFKPFLERRGARVEVIYLPAGEGGEKQGVDDYLAAGHSVEKLLALATTDLREVADGGPPFPPVKGLTGLPLAELRARAAPVLQASNPLVVFENSLRACGFSGDPRPAKITYLAATTRVLAIRQGAMPAHTLFVGPPSSGKNWLVNTTLRYLPPEACHVIDAASPRVLIYDEVDLQHRVLLFAEADSLPTGEDNPAASAVRNLLQDHRLHYKVVIRDPETGRFVVRTIDRLGPTILFTTAVRRLGQQLESRLFVMEVPDDQKQIAAALAAQADLELVGPADPPEALVAFQAYLQAQAPWHVVVPFARTLAEAIGKSPAVPRVLRDYARLLALIKAAAVLRHEHRQRDAKGRLVAEVEDYATVYELVADMYAASATGAGEKVRATVEAVAALKADGVEPITATAVGKQLLISKQAASGRIDTALRGGWLVNHEQRAGKPYRLDTGDPLPAGSGLPRPEEVGGQGVNPLTGRNAGEEVGAWTR